MKKITSLIMALAMAMSLAVPAFAEPTGTISSSTSGTASGSSNIGGSVNNTTAAYVMVIPAGNNEMNLTNKTTAQDIGSLTVKLNSSDANKTFDTQKKVSVSIASANKGKLKNATETITSNNTLDYTLGMTQVTNTTVSDASVTTSEWPTSAASNPTVDFAAEGITSTGTSVAMTATITGTAADVANGTYQDILTFNASVKAADVTYTLTGSNANNKVLKASAMLATDTSTFTYNNGTADVTYTAYNGYISETAYANWADAKAFVQALNNASYDDCSNWTLLSGQDMAYAWWLSTDSSIETAGTYNFGTVNRQWSSVDSNENGYCWKSWVARNKVTAGKSADIVKSNGWGTDVKNCSIQDNGFVVLRPATNNAG